MRRTEALQGVRMAVFVNILNRRESGELNQAEAAELLGVSERTFRRWRSPSAPTGSNPLQVDVG
jgi:DNA-binding transcriptional regulator YiaG